MGDSETYVTKVECLTQHRQMDQKINEEIEKIRAESKSDHEKVDEKIAKVYQKIDNILMALIALIITSGISILLTLFSLWANSRF